MTEKKNPHCNLIIFNTNLNIVTVVIIVSFLNLDLEADF